MTESLNQSVLELINSVLEKIEKPLKQKKPNVKSALIEINLIRTICLEVKTESVEPVPKMDMKSRSIPLSTYGCLYQCGFKTTSIREIDNHLTNLHGHPEPNRDYSHPIYNE